MEEKVNWSNEYSYTVYILIYWRTTIVVSKIIYKQQFVKISIAAVQRTYYKFTQIVKH